MSRDTSCSLTALTGANACNLPVGQGFQYSIVNLAVCNVHALFLGPHATFLSHHTPGEAQLSVFNDLTPSQRDCDTGRVVHSTRHHPSSSCNRPDPRARRSSISLLLQPSRGPPTPCGRLLFTTRGEATPAQPRSETTLFFFTRPSSHTGRFAQWIWQSSWCAPACAHSTSSPTSTSATFSSLTPWSSTQRRLCARSRERATSDLLNHCSQAARR